jgi:hypothetical protein
LGDEAADEAVIARMAQIQQPLAAVEERRAPRAEGQPAGVVDEDIRRQPVRPSAAARAQTEVRLLPVASAEHLGVQEPHIVQAVAAQVQTGADPHWNFDRRPRVAGCREVVQRAGVAGVEFTAQRTRIAGDGAVVAERGDRAHPGVTVGRCAQAGQPIAEHQGVGVQEHGIVRGV